MISPGGWGGVGGEVGVRWGEVGAGMPAISFPLRAGKRRPCRLSLRPSLIERVHSAAGSYLEEGRLGKPAARLFWPDTSSVSSLNLNVVDGKRRLRPAFPLDVGQVTGGSAASFSHVRMSGLNSILN